MSFDIFHVLPYCYGGLYLEGRFIGEFFALRVWETYIWRGLFSLFYGIKILTWLLGFKDKIAIISRLHCLAIPSLSTTKPNQI